MTKAKARTTATATKLHEDDDNLVAEPVIVNFSAIDDFEMVIAPQHQRNALNTFECIEGIPDDPRANSGHPLNASSTQFVHAPAPSSGPAI